MHNFVKFYVHKDAKENVTEAYKRLRKFLETDSLSGQANIAYSTTINIHERVWFTLEVSRPYLFIIFGKLLKEVENEKIS